MTNQSSRTQPDLTGSEIRSARKSDTREVAELWCLAFPARRSVEDRVRMLEEGGRYGGLETVLVARTTSAPGEGAATAPLAGACKIYRLESHIAGVPMPTMGLAAVAVAPAWRRRGLGAHLCSRAMETAVARGDVLSLLYPFRPDYYERLGWGLVGALHEHRFHTMALPEYEEARHVRVATGAADVSAIAASYARVAARSNGPMTRDGRVWGYRLAAQDLGVRPLDHDAASWAAPPNSRLRAVVFDDGSVTGYALLRRRSGSSDRAATLEIREIVAETERAYRGLLGHIAGQADHWPRARHFARPEERFGDRLSEPRPPGFPVARSLYFPVARVVRGPMLRVLDVPGALRLRRWFDSAAGSPTGPARVSSAGSSGASSAASSGGLMPFSGKTLSISVEDAQLPDNRGPWTVRFGMGHVEGGAAEGGAVERGVVERGAAADADASLSTDPATFARIFAGEIPASAAQRLGQAEVSGDTDLVDRAFATRERFWLLDEF